jgi:glucosamine--fructose-6-phosphate aminotransferase (isomerizing)
MCGIVGGISLKLDMVPFVLNGLQAVEYRGYDSAGLVTIENNQLVRHRVTGEVKELRVICEAHNLKGNIVIGHTRWATHGTVTVDNTHPHVSHDAIAIVHNGIIENYTELKQEMIDKGYEVITQTDTEIIAHLIYSFYAQNQDLLLAVQLTTKKLVGAYAFAVITKDNPNEIVCAIQYSPLLLAIDNDSFYFASDINALLPVSGKIVFLEDGDVVSIKTDGYKIINNGIAIDRSIHVYDQQQASVNLGSHEHFMEKEIFEQSVTATNTINYLGSDINPAIFGVNAESIFSSIEAVQIIACGTSYHAGLVAKYWIEEYAKIPCYVSIASEYTYSKTPPQPNHLVVSISQSGETADTIAAIKYAKSLGMNKTLAICNVAHSTLTRISELQCLTQAGVEVGVASTKAFTTQLIVLLYLTFSIAKSRKIAFDHVVLIENIRKLPHLITSVISQSLAPIKQMALSLQNKYHCLFLGRNVLLPIAHEASLKIKEISYIHAESYPSGELKHGPIALIDNKMPVFSLLSKQILFDKSLTSVAQVLARNGDIYIISDREVPLTLNEDRILQLLLPQDLPSYLLPILFTLPVQLLAYYTAVFKGTNVDKPRNLAKSVTVE